MPTGYTPIYRIEKGGINITDRFNDRCTQIKIDLQAGNGESDQCTITLDDRDWAISRPFPGETIGIWLGYEELGLAYMGTFNINDVLFNGMPRTIMLIGRSSGLNDLQKAPTVREFDNQSIGSILNKMASQTGLQAAIGGELAGITIPFKNQITSNYHMIHELERMYGAVAKVVDGKLMFVKRDGRTTAAGTELPTIILNPQHFGTWSVKHSSRPTAGSVQASWWDDKDMVRRWVEHAGGGTDSGGEVFGGPMQLGGIFNSAEEALAGAKSKMEALRRAEMTGRFDLAKGDPWIRDQLGILVTGMRDGIDGGYIVDKATHTFIRSTGIKTTLECKASGPGDNLAEASKEFWQPIGNETVGDLLARGGVPSNVIEISPM
ncbi:phage protein D [Bradyrhizobium sp. AZCC 1610]|uniref:phage late control D family protein n=1 Tax=Bradyrhizobium sp. AZCC 1610 TaxID=3117020 RepID=UPI002FF09B2D